MNRELLLNHFNRISDAPDAIPHLRQFVLELAVRGKLVDRDPKDEPSTALLDRIQAERDTRVTNGQRKKQEALTPVRPEEILFDITAHVISEKYGQYSQQANFPTLLGQAFTVLGVATPHTPPQPGESHCGVERSLYEAGCAVNALRNKTGTGHGRPFLPGLSDDEARAAVQLIGIISGLLLRALKKNP